MSGLEDICIYVYFCLFHPYWGWTQLIMVGILVRFTVFTEVETCNLVLSMYFQILTLFNLHCSHILRHQIVLMLFVHHEFNIGIS